MSITSLPLRHPELKNGSQSKENNMIARTEQDGQATLDAHDGIALVTLNRPDKLNALDYETIDCLQRLLDTIEKDDSVRVVVLTGKGRAFSAGADIRGFSESVHAGVSTALREFVGRGQALTRRVENFPKPIVGAVNGLAYGGGCEIIEACPLAIASETAAFAKPEINLGFPPPFGGSQRLPRLVGRKRALYMILTGEPITAERAAAIGLVNEVVPAERLLERATEVAKIIIEKSALAVTACLTSVTRGINLTIDEGLAVEASQFARMVPTSDIKEGIRAFTERRTAHFAGR
jgi:enoyl-CoA hydratase/carnithine racemase